MFSSKKKIVVGSIVAVVLLAAAFFVFKLRPQAVPVASQNSEKTVKDFATTTVAATSSIETSATSAPYIIPGQKDKPTPEDIQKNPTLYVNILADDDRDGLTNPWEIRYGTDMKNPDTDGDGLTDYQEAMSYFTSPINPDTDGDGHKDGEEIKNGFNPCGEGKLPFGSNLAKACQKFKK